MQKKVAVVMGSDSDLSTMQPCLDRLRAFSIPFVSCLPIALLPPRSSLLSPLRKRALASSSPPPEKRPTWPE